MPPLLVDWEDINIAVDRERNDIRYFSIVDNKFLGRIAFKDVTKITICGMIRERGLRGLTSPVTSPGECEREERSDEDVERERWDIKSILY